MISRTPVISLCAILCLPAGSLASQQLAQPAISSRSTPIIVVDGLRFRDLNRDGKLEIYEDWRRSAQDRADDLLDRMNLAEMAGIMMHGTAPASGNDGTIGRGTQYDLGKARDLILNTGVNTFITRLEGDPESLAEADNSLQAVAEQSRLGIPVTLSTDPRSHFLYTLGASAQNGGFSKWPETTGLAAIGDPGLVRHFADVVRREYRAVGIREALSPQADLATEPRWARMNGTFGEDADVAKQMVKAYVEGMQAGPNGLNPQSVLTVVKHWVGYGAQKDGLDSHNAYGRFAVFPGGNFAYHQIPFTGAFEAHVAAVMPTYSILEGVTVAGKPLEPVGAGFNRPLLETLLRGTYHFDGVVLSDWGITSDCPETCEHGAPAGQTPDVKSIAMSWGVESLSKEDRFAKTINAGVDQIGGTDQAKFVVDAVNDGKITKDRVRESVRRILIQKFEIGLFEDPFVDAHKAPSLVGTADDVREGEEAQKRAVVLLKNAAHTLPLVGANAHAKVFLSGIDPTAASAAGLRVVETSAAADFCLIRAATPYELLHPGFFFGSRQHEGRLDLRAGDPAFEAVAACGKTPVLMAVYLDRPAILTNVKDRVAVLMGDFGISDKALLQLITGQGRPQGHLPFELPSSMQEVEAQKPDLPHDTAHPLFPYGFGLVE